MYGKTRSCAMEGFGCTLTNITTETERSSGWQPWYSLETLKTSFNVSSEYQDCHPDDLSVSVTVLHQHPGQWQWKWSNPEKYEWITSLIQKCLCKSMKTNMLFLYGYCRYLVCCFCARYLHRLTKIKIWIRHPLFYMGYNYSSMS